MDLSVVIVSYNTRDMLRACLRALPEAAAGLAVEVFVVDNHSPDDSVEMVRREFPDVHLIANSDNPGFARANNQALRISQGRYVVLLNPDTEATPGSLTTLAHYLDQHSDVGMVGPKLLNTDGSLQKNGFLFPTPLREFIGHSGLSRLNPRLFTTKMRYGREDFNQVWETDVLFGACMMVPRPVMERVGLLDEDFFMFYEEVEWCWRIRRAGYKVVYVPQSRVTHHWMGSVRQQSKASTARLYRSMPLYYRKTAGRGAQMFMRGVSWMGLAKNELLYLGVAVKRRLRAAHLIK